MGPNWGVFRRSMFTARGLHWDEDYRIGGEHIDFYLRVRLVHPDLKAGFSERLSCQHIDGGEGEYDALRTRGGWLDTFRAKWPFRYRYDLGGVLRMMETYDKPEPVPSASVDRLRDALRQVRNEADLLRRQLAKNTSP